VFGEKEKFMEPHPGLNIQNVPEEEREDDHSANVTRRSRMCIVNKTDKCFVIWCFCFINFCLAH
jgi:hypothetical protein